MTMATGGRKRTVRAKALRRPPVSYRPPSLGAAAQRARIREQLRSRSAHLGPLQPSLVVGSANDPAEHEADRTAAAVLSMPAPAAPLERTKTDGAPPLRRETGSQPNLDEFEHTPPLPADQQEPTVAPEEDIDTEGLDEEDMAELESGEPAGTGTDAEEAADDDGKAGGESEVVQAKEAVMGAAGGAAPAEVAASVAAPGPGRPLPKSLRQFMEPRFRADFSGVRLYDQPHHRAAARRIGARAFTHRRGIWLGPGEAAVDRRLMAHELTHVLQQNPGFMHSEERAPAPAIAARPIDRSLRRSWVTGRLEPHARRVPGYTLLTTIIGKSPLTGERVARNPTNLVGGLLGLIPGGTDLFNKLRETQVLQRAFDWVMGKLSSLNITWSRVVAAARKAWDDFSFIRLSLEPVRAAFRPLIRDVRTFISSAWSKLKELVISGALKRIGPHADKVWGVVKRAGGVIGLILRNPAGFAVNLFKAVYRGFSQFGSKILTYLKDGLMDWLFGTMQGMNLTMPPLLNFQGMISIALQLVGLTYQRFRAVLVKRLGQGGERKVAMLEQGVSFVTTLVNQGFAGVWQKALEYIENFKTTVIDGIRNWVQRTIVTQAVAWAARLSNPVGGIIGIAKAIYDVIVVFIQRFQQIVELANSLFESIGRIARGDVSAAANSVEASMARTVPVIISFFARLLNLHGITGAIRNIIEKVRAPVERAMERFVGFVVKKAKHLFSKIVARLNRKRKLPGSAFQLGDGHHHLRLRKTGRRAELVIESEPKTVSQTVTELREEREKLPEDSPARAGFDNVANAVKASGDAVDPHIKNVDLESSTQNNRKPLTDAASRTGKGATEIPEAGRQVANMEEVESANEPGGALLRAAPLRFKYEGLAGTHHALKEETRNEGEGGTRYSSTYEVDHVPQKAPLLHLHKEMPNVLRAHQQATAEDSEAGDGGLVRDSEEASRTGAAEPPEISPPPFGKLEEIVSDTGGKMSAIIIDSAIHRDKTNRASAGKEQIKGAIDNARSSNTTPIDKIRDIITNLITEEKQEITALYTAQNGNRETGVTEQTVSNVTKGLDEVEKLARADYGMAEPSSLTGQKEERANQERGRRETKLSETEGALVPYGESIEDSNEFEKDHIIEQAYPRAVKDLTLGSAKLPHLIDIKQSARNAVTRESGVKDERDSASGSAASSIEEKCREINSARLFDANSRMAKYDPESVQTLVLYKPVHRVINPPNSSRIFAAIAKQDFSAVEAFLANPKATRFMPNKLSAIRARIKEAFKEQFDSHENQLLTAFARQEQVIVNANPGREEAAKEQHRTIDRRIRSSLADMRKSTFDLFI